MNELDETSETFSQIFGCKTIFSVLLLSADGHAIFQLCHEEKRNLVQNIPDEECGLEPKESCKMETVLVPRYTVNLSSYLGTL